jgi:hypothetical protein
MFEHSISWCAVFAAVAFITIALPVGQVRKEQSAITSHATSHVHLFSWSQAPCPLQALGHIAEHLVISTPQAIISHVLARPCIEICIDRDALLKSHGL